MRETTAKEARRRSLEFCERHGIPANPHLPLIEESGELAPPSAKRVARRCVVLSCAIGVAYGADREILTAWLRDHGLWEDASPRERELLAKPEITERERRDATWLTECIQVLGWGLGLVSLDHFRHCDDDLASHFPRPQSRSPSDFIDGAALRPFDEIHRECDLLYCLHWASRDADLRGEPSKLDEGIVMERDRAIRWLAGVESEWDAVDTST